MRVAASTPERYDRARDGACPIGTAATTPHRDQPSIAAELRDRDTAPRIHASLDSEPKASHPAAAMPERDNRPRREASNVG